MGLVSGGFVHAQFLLDCDIDKLLLYSFVLPRSHSSLSLCSRHSRHHRHLRPGLDLFRHRNNMVFISYTASYFYSDASGYLDTTPGAPAIDAC